MKKRLINFFLFLLVAPLFSESFVNGYGTYLFKDPALKQPSFFLPGGSKVKILKKLSSTLQIATKKAKGYVKKSSLSTSDSVFSSNPSQLSLNEDILSNRNLVYLVRDQLVFFDVLERKSFFREKTIPANSIKSSRDMKHILFIGEERSKNKEVDHYRLYQSESHQMISVGSFNHRNQLLTRAEFSKNGRYFFLLFQNRGKHWLYLYDESARLLASLRVFSADWRENELLLLTSEGFSKIIPSQLDQNILTLPTKDLRIYSFKADKNTEMRILGKDIFFLHHKKVKKLSHSEITETPLKSLFFTEQMRYQYFERKGSHTLQKIATHSSLPYFNGVHPKKQFIAFLGEKILYQKKSDKVETFFLMDPKENTIYKYKAIDRIDASNQEGILAEAMNEKDLKMIVIEIPTQKTFYFITEAF